MPDIDNQQVVSFANTRIRPLSDAATVLYYRAKSMLADYNSGDIGTKIEAAGSANIVSDGSATDGRTQITGGDIYNFITAMQALVTYVEGGSVPAIDRTTVLSKPHVNGI